MKNLVFRVYNPNRLEWHLGVESRSRNPSVYCVVLYDSKRVFWTDFQTPCCCSRQEPRPQSILRGFCFWRPYSTRKQSVCMDGLEVNTAHLHTRVQNVTELGLGIGKAIGSSGGKLGQLYKRINPSSALGLFVYLR